MLTRRTGGLAETSKGLDAVLGADEISEARGVRALAGSRVPERVSVLSTVLMREPGRGGEAAP